MQIMAKVMILENQKSVKANVDGRYFIPFVFNTPELALAFFVVMLS